MLEIDIILHQHLVLTSPSYASACQPLPPTASTSAQRKRQAPRPKGTPIEQVVKEYSWAHALDGAGKQSFGGDETSVLSTPIGQKSRVTGSDQAGTSTDPQRPSWAHVTPFAVEKKKPAPNPSSIFSQNTKPTRPAHPLAQSHSHSSNEESQQEAEDEDEVARLIENGDSGSGSSGPSPSAQPFKQSKKTNGLRPVTQHPVPVPSPEKEVDELATPVPAAKAGRKKKEKVGGDDGVEGDASVGAKGKGKRKQKDVAEEVGAEETPKTKNAKVSKTA